MSGSFFPHLIFQLFAPELHHGFPGTFRGPEHLESSFVAGLAHKQRCFALFPHPATCRLLIIHLRLHTHTHTVRMFLKHQHTNDNFKKNVLTKAFQYKICDSAWKI